MEDSPIVNGSQDSSELQHSPSESIDTSQTSDSNSPKTAVKKNRTQPDSNSSSTPPANKQAKLTPRATRSSQNPDFAAKQRKFLNRVHDPIRRDNSDSENSQGSNTPGSSKTVKDVKNKLAERKSGIGSDVTKKLDKDGTPKRPADTEEEGSSKKRRTKEVCRIA